MSRLRKPLHVSRGILNTRFALKRLSALLRTPMFWMISFWGNLWILIWAVVFFWAENGVNPEIQNFLDSLLWAVGLVTTVGSHIKPVTGLGKMISIGTMMGGAIFLWSYMALFVGALVDPELKYIEREVAELQREMPHPGKGPRSK